MSTQQVDYNTIITRRNQLVSLLLSGRLYTGAYNAIKIGNLSMRENLVMTSAYVRPYRL